MNYYPQWLQALRSGQYDQTQGTLYDGNGYCCLGLAEHVCLAEEFNYDEDTGEYKDSDGSGDLLTRSTAANLNLDQPVEPEDIDVLDRYGYAYQGGPDLTPGKSMRQNLLAGLNDSGHSFREIAEAIELLGWDKENT